jgi:7,8-dihydropterin-6-yl-methyl-4-(beta-D-ribofuranosyl)aminobenzene 5'-phosphate synthase
MISLSTLVENTGIRPDFPSEHGLSFFLQTENRKILFDMGGSPLFWDNAVRLGSDLAQIGYAVISHGHNDHGGGLRTFLERNKTAKVYLSSHAFEGHFSKRETEWRDVGLDPSFAFHSRIVEVSSDLAIDETAFLFGNVTGREFFSSRNANLFKEDPNGKIPDDFDHEIHLVVREGKLRILLIGCAHTGVVNILRRFHQIFGNDPTHVIGGFHFSSRSTSIGEDPETVRAIARILKETGAVFWTGHCTGAEAYRIMKPILGTHLHSLSAGKKIILSSEENR